MTTSTDLKTFKIAKGTKAQIITAYNNGDIGDTDFAIATDETYSDRDVGELVYSAMPLTDAGLHLLDGSLISGGGIYDEFVQYVAGLVSDYPDLFVTEASWQAAVSANGVCGKFVYDSSGDGSVRLPKITGIIEGTTSVSALGDLVAAGLPNITGSIASVAYSTQSSGALLIDTLGGYNQSGSSATLKGETTIRLDASNSNSIYGNSTTVQPQTIKQLVYIVIANSTKTQIEVDIDQVATDLNGKADTDLGNLSNGLANVICTSNPSTVSTASSAAPAVVVQNYRSGSSWYRVYSDKWCEQGGTQTGSGSLQTISFLKTFADTNYSIQVSAGYWSNQLPGYETSTKTTSSAKIYGLNGYEYSWQASGYIS